MNPFCNKEPFFIQWHITDFCNLSCRHCYRESPGKDLDLKDLFFILDNVSDFITHLSNPSFRIQLSGGEPFLSPHLLPLAQNLHSRKIPYRILSNGTCFEEKTLNELSSAGLRVIQVSIDGLEGTHDSLRGAGSFKKTLEGLRLLRERKFDITLAVTLSRENVKETGKILEMAKPLCSRIGFSRLVPCGSGTAMKQALLTPREIREAFREIHRFKKQYPIPEIPLRDPLWKPFLGQMPGCNKMTGCSAGLGGLSIDVDGSVYPCRRLPLKAGNALDTPLIRIWTSEIMEELRDRKKLKGCASCIFRWNCGGGCRAIAHALTGNIFERDPQCFYTPGILDRLALKFLPDPKGFPVLEGGD